MVAQSLLVLTTGRLFCSRYVDSLPVRIVRCPVAFPPLTYYQLWHDLTHASAAEPLVARAGARGGAQPRPATACCSGRARGTEGRADDGAAPGDLRRPARLHGRAGLGRDGDPARCAGGPATGCWWKAAASSRCRREAPDASWERHDHAGRLILPGFIDTHVHSPQLDVIASYGTELLDWLNTYTFPAERRYADPAQAAGRRGAVPRRAAGPRHHRGGGVPDRAQGVGRRAVRRRRSSAACA